jgi:hypothetical protein
MQKLVRAQKQDVWAEEIGSRFNEELNLSFSAKPKSIKNRNTTLK